MSSLSLTSASINYILDKRTGTSEFQEDWVSYTSKENYVIGDGEDFERHWRTTQVGDKLNNGEWSKNHTAFTIMSYNVLADYLMKGHPELYNQSLDILDWDQRWRRILKEIETFKPDILCCQEVQNDHYHSHFAPDLSALNFVGLYKKRTGDKADGCAIFYRKDKFVLEDYTDIEYRQPTTTTLDRDNIALLGKFRPSVPHGRSAKSKGKMRIHAEFLNHNRTQCDSFVVATTHLLYNPKRQDVRLAQVAVLFAELDRFAYKSQADLDISPPTTKQEYFYPCILTGDFNLNPDDPIYASLISNGQIFYRGLSYRLTGSLFPPSLGVTDTCQHLETILARCSSILQNTTSKQNSYKVCYTSQLFKGGTNVMFTPNFQR